MMWRRGGGKCKVRWRDKEVILWGAKERGGQMERDI